MTALRSRTTLAWLLQWPRPQSAPQAERTIPGLIRLIGRLMKKFSPEECRNFLCLAGYAC
jgi:hypothetical protein